MIPTTTLAISTQIEFTKMSATGNDFLIIDARTKPLTDRDRSSFAKSLCRRQFGIGADGLIFVDKTSTPNVDFSWDFYNADGSKAEMCGNAARCVARYALEKKISGPEANIETGAGVVRTKINENNFVEVQMPTPQVYEKVLDVPIGEHIKVQVAYVNTGVPHAVKLTDDWQDEYLHEMGHYLRNSALFLKTNGANATFYEVTGPSAIQSATYERGVEAVTLSCGTGAVAAALTAVLNGMKGPVEVQVPGGVLTVNIGSDLKSATLFGEARFICEGIIRSEALI